MLSGCKKEEQTGVELLEQANYEEAVTRFHEYISEGQNLEESYRGLGIAYWEQGDFRRARGAFSKALNYGATETATIYNFLGVCDMQLGYYSQSIEWFEKGITLEGAEGDIVREMEFNQIVSYEKLEEWDKAREKLNVYIGKYPDDEQASKEALFLETR